MDLILSSYFPMNILNLWDSILTNSNGKLTDERFILSNTIINESIELGIYVVTNQWETYLNCAKGCYNIQWLTVFCQRKLKEIIIQGIAIVIYYNICALRPKARGYYQTTN
jgi:hypothetical protein